MQSLTILVVEDEPSLLLSTVHAVKHLGHKVLSAENGIEALEKLREHRVDVIISDWAMPKMDGLALCGEVRKRYSSPDNYVYFLILTAKDSQENHMLGLNAGADDFMVKPIMIDELRVRLKAGFQFNSLKKSLFSSSEPLKAPMETTQETNFNVREAKELERNLLPDPCSINGIQFDWVMHQSENPGGDMLGYQEISDGKIEFYHIHVGGRVMASMMLATNLRNLLAGRNKSLDTQNAQTPVELLKELNSRFSNTGQGKVYFSMVYGIIDPAESSIQFAKAGHHTPLIYSAEQQFLKSVGHDSLPLGLTSNIPLEVVTMPFKPGDRLIVGSEGVTNILNPYDEEYGVRRFYQLAQQSEKDSNNSLTHSILGALVKWHGTIHFDDDVSVLVIENQTDQASDQNVA